MKAARCCTGRQMPMAKARCSRATSSRWSRTAVTSASCEVIQISSLGPPKAASSRESNHSHSIKLRQAGGKRTFYRTLSAGHSIAKASARGRSVSLNLRAKIQRPVAAFSSRAPRSDDLTARRAWHTLLDREIGLTRIIESYVRADGPMPWIRWHWPIVVHSARPDSRWPLSTMSRGGRGILIAT